MDKKEEKRLRIGQLKQWLTDVMELRGWTPYAWAKKADVYPSYVQRAVIDEPASEMKPDTLSLLAKAAGVELPKIDLSQDRLPVTESDAEDAYREETNKPPRKSDKVQVMQLDVRFGMGGGAIYDAPVEAQPMSFSRAWLQQLTPAPADQLFWASGFGDSMFPTISDGDIVLVDCSQKQPRIRDQIWALNQYGQGMIKRLRATETGYLIMSDNPQVPTDQATDGSMEIVGRVVAVVRRL